jgi:hypothetical protein
MVNFVVSAQQQSVFGDAQQPGYKLHQEILSNIALGQNREESIYSTIISAVSEESSILTPEAKSALAFNTKLSSNFYAQMLLTNSLIESVKVLIEENSNLAANVVSIGTYLYPDFAQQVVNGAALSGSIEPNDALAIALASGADPSTVSTATAASGSPTPTSPIGSGIGGGGSGGGDTTASSN